MLILTSVVNVLGILFTKSPPNAKRLNENFSKFCVKLWEMLTFVTWPRCRSGSCTRRLGSVAFTPRSRNKTKLM